MRRTARWLAVPSLCGALAACGTTVPTGTATGGPSADGTTGLTAPADLGTSTPTGVLPGQAVVTPAQAVGGGGTPGSTTGEVAGTTGPAATPSLGGALTGRGFTATTITIGVATADD